MPLQDMKKPLIRGGGSRHLEASMSPDPGAPLVGILGTGDFSRSLARRLVASGYQVVVGSRNPKRSVGLFPEEAEVTSQTEAASQAQLVFVALFPEHYSTLEGLKAPLAGKVLVDVSNSVRLNLAGPANAELLADMFPESYVVKAFNTVSAWTLQMGAMDGSRQVLLCGDCRQSKETVAQLCRSMGFLPVDAGLLSVSLEVENQPLRLFPSWRVPVLATLALCAFFYLYNFTHDVLHPFVTKGERRFHKMPVDTVNVTLPSVSLVLLGLVYLPGVLAAGLQLRRGTKYSRFPAWLDGWLLRRKQLGLCSFVCAAMHAVYSLALPMMRSHRYGLLNDAYKQVKAGQAVSWDEEQVWRMELYVSVGIMALGVLSLLAVSSLPTVANSLNWREFSFIQSSLGYAALSLGTLHTLLFGWDRAFDGSRYHFYLPPTFMLVLALPVAVLLARGALALPCLAQRLARIRRGWEKSRRIRFAMPGDDGGGSMGVCNGQSMEDMTDV